MKLAVYPVFQLEKTVLSDLLSAASSCSLFPSRHGTWAAHKIHKVHWRHKLKQASRKRLKFTLECSRPSFVLLQLSTEWRMIRTMDRILYLLLYTADYSCCEALSKVSWWEVFDVKLRFQQMLKNIFNLCGKSKLFAWILLKMAE